MSSQIFSRSFLQNLREERKEEQINDTIRGFIDALKNAAAEGKTSYMYDHDNCRVMKRVVNDYHIPVITNDEIISGFQKKFPGCKVSYQETWVDIDSNTRVLKKGIIIDWS
jgi:hypothetical protein